jgi:uncharacterized protein (DUF1778 family)
MIDSGRYPRMKKSISISIRVSEEELDKFKQAARLEAYASYSEFVRRTALIEAEKVINKRAENESK